MSKSAAERAKPKCRFRVRTKWQQIHFEIFDETGIHQGFTLDKFGTQPFIRRMLRKALRRLQEAYKSGERKVKRGK